MTDPAVPHGMNDAPLATDPLWGLSDEFGDSANQEVEEEKIGPLSWVFGALWRIYLVPVFVIMFLVGGVVVVLVRAAQVLVSLPTRLATRVQRALPVPGPHATTGPSSRSRARTQG